MPMCAVVSTLSKTVPQPEMGLPSCLTFRHSLKRTICGPRRGNGIISKHCLPRGLMLQPLILWRPGVGFCLGIHCEVSSQLRRYIHQTGKNEEPCLVLFSSRVADGTTPAVVLKLCAKSLYWLPIAA